MLKTTKLGEIDDDMKTARGRLKGLLRDLTDDHFSDDADEDQEAERSELQEDDEIVDHSAPKRGRPPKKMKLETSHSTFVTKLFDRNIDLSRYNESSALYPICREWIQDKPNGIKKYKAQKPLPPRKEHSSLLDNIKSGKLSEVMELPAIKHDEISKIPALTAEQKEACKDRINLDYDIDNPPKSTKVLLSENRKRWCKVRQEWAKQSRLYENKYTGSFKVLEAIGFNNAFS